MPSMGLDVDGPDLSKKYKEVCADLNLDKSSADEAWQSFQRIGINYTLEGEKLQWLACALYVSCRKGQTPTIGGRGGYIEGNCVSLTRLLRSCKLSLVQFFIKMKKWSDMANLPHEMRNKIDHHERNFNVSTVIFKKFRPIFLTVFKDPSTSPSKVVVKNKKQSRKQLVTSSDVFSFCWTLFIHVKANFPAISDDLVNSYHLLLACIDFCYSNAIVADNCKELLNETFSELPANFGSEGFRPPESVHCVIQALCTSHDGLYTDAKGIKEHWWKPYIKRMIEKRQLKVRAHQLLGVFDVTHYEFNFKSIMKEYDQHVLSIGDFDERVFLAENASQELGTPQISTDELKERMLMKQGIMEHVDDFRTLTPSTPLTNRHYLKNKEVMATPVSQATHTVGQLQSLLLDRKPEPSPALLAIFDECSTNPKENILKLVKHMGDIFVNAYSKPSNDADEHEEIPVFMQASEFAKKRLDLGLTFYFKCLENIMIREKKSLQNSSKLGEDLSALLSRDMMHVSLFACCMEIILYSYNSQRAFPWIIEILSSLDDINFQPFHFYKVIELLIREEEGLSRMVVKHLNLLEEQILECMAWKSDSALWDAIKQQRGVPSCEAVALAPATGGNTNTILASPMAAVKRITREVFTTPLPDSAAAQRFSNVIASGAKRKLFDQNGGESSSTPQQFVTISLPHPTNAGEVRLYQIPASALQIQSATESPVKAQEAPRKKASPLGLFFRKVYHLAYLRMRDLCERLSVNDDDLRRKIWTCFELSLRDHTEMMRDRHIDQILMCAIYSMCKVTKQDVSFQDIMKCYRLQPQSKSHIYRSVLLSNRARRDSAGSGRSRRSGSNSPNGVSQEEKERIRSSSTLPVPHPNSQPPTPTRLAGTGSQFEFGEERGDLIMFYNQVYVPELKSYIMKFTVESQSPILSPLPRLAAHPISPCRRISQKHHLFISPMKAPNFPPSPKRPMSYSFLRSPAKELKAINQMMRQTNEKKPISVSKRILQDDGHESENSPAKRALGDPALIRSKIANIFTERQGSTASDDSSSAFGENGLAGAHGN